MSNADTPRYLLRIGERSLLLSVGLVIKGDQLGLARRQTVIRVDPHPQDDEQLVLVNLSNVAWQVRAADGEQRTIQPQQPVRVETGRRIDFGGAIGTIMADVKPVRLDQLVPVETTTLAMLSRKLVRAAEQKIVTQEQFDRLHKVFYAYDARGTGWTIGLQDRRWARWESTGWIVDQPPNHLLIDPRTLTKLHALEQQLKKKP